MLDNPGGQVAGGPRNWGTGFMPAVFQGTRISGGDEPIANLRTPAEIGLDRQRGKLALLSQLNRRHHQTPVRQYPSSTPGSRATSWPSGCRRKPPRPWTSARESEETRCPLRP